MPRYIIACLSAAFLAGCTHTPQKPPAADADASFAAHQTVVLTVHGLSCPLCSNNLDGQLRRIPGVADAAIDLKTGAVTVRLQPRHSVTRAQLTAAVEQAGFTLKDIQPVSQSE